MDARELWSTLSASLEVQLAPSAYQSLFQNLRPLELTTSTLTMAVGSEMIKRRIETRHGEIINATIAECEGHSAHEVEFLVMDLDQPVSPPPLDVPRPRIAPAPPPAEEPPAVHGARPSGVFNSRYTFDDFVIGPSNRFAQAAALAVAETPARSYNPLFIYGAAGLGKTHLLHAIGHYISENYPAYKIRYVSTETFLNQFIDSIRTTTMTTFKAHYRNIDVLLVDDIQFIEGKEGFQEEFFHTFNTLHETSRQIVLSSDRPPDNIPTLEDRLRSRFKMGLITDVHPPDVETRLAILRQKAEPHAAQIPPEVYKYIAENFSDNIRELEGALTRLLAYARLEDTPVTIELAHTQLYDVLSSSKPKPVTVEVILNATSEMFEFAIEDIIGRNRRRPLVTARQIAMYVTRNLTQMSYPDIARNFGGRDHTTVIHAVDKITKLMAERRQIYDQVTELMAIVQNPRSR